MTDVNVIIPLYNKARYIRRTLDSVFSQEYSDFELIVVDDGSTDEGPSIVGEYRDPRLRLVRQKNAGPGAARNRGLRESTARYVAFLDGDDEWLPGFLGTAMARLQGTDDCQVFVSNHFRGQDGTTFLDVHPGLTLATGPTRLPTDIQPQQVKAYIDLFACGAIVAEKHVVEQYNGFFENRCTYGEDAFLWLRMLLNRMFFFQRDPLLRVHLTSSELSHGRATPYPVHPIVAYPEAILACCPAAYRGLIERTLDYYALISLWRRIDCGDYDAARRILAAFPYTWRSSGQFLKARIKVSALSGWERLSDVRKRDKTR